MSRPSTPGIADNLKLALRLADEASALALDLLTRGTHSERKADGTVVTDADLEVERMLSAELASERPDDAVLVRSSEDQARRPDDGYSTPSTARGTSSPAVPTGASTSPSNTTGK